MTKESPFETYWADHEAYLIKRHYRTSLIEMLRGAAEQAWNHARSYEHEQILEANVIINKGIYEMLMDLLDMMPEQIKNNRNTNGKI